MKTISPIKLCVILPTFFFSVVAISCSTTPPMMVNAEGELVACDPDEVDDYTQDGYMLIESAGFIGIEIDTTAPFKILRVVNASHAKTLGIKEGDFLVSVSGEEIKDYARAYSLMFGKAETEIPIVVSAGGSPKHFVVHRKTYGTLFTDSNSKQQYGTSRTTYVGPRGGVYHYSKSGKKVYESSGKKRSKGK